MSPDRPDWKRNLIITSVATLTILLAAEGALRLWDYFFRHPYRRFDARLGMVRPVPGYRATVNGKVVTINSRGFRAAEFAQEKPPGVFRIVMLGDSVTFGLMEDGDCHYPGQLQRRFDAEGPGRVEVINAALEGYNSADVLRLLELELMDYSPDMVTVLIGWNDLIKQDPAHPGVSAIKTRLAYSLFDVYLIKLWRWVIFKHLRPLLLRPSNELSPAEERAMRSYVPLVYQENLQRIIATARAGGSDVVLFTIPSLLRPDLSPQDMRKLFFPYFTYNLRKFLLLYERYNETVRDIGRINRVPVIELQEPVKGRESQLFMDPAHLECAGLRILGEHLHGVLSGLIRRERRGANRNGR